MSNEIKDIKNIKDNNNAVRLKILELKAEVYELIKEQELLTFKNSQIQEKKLKFIQEINALESLHGTEER